MHASRSSSVRRLLPLHLLVAALFQGHACLDPADASANGPDGADDDSATPEGVVQGVLIEVEGADAARVRAESPAGLELDWTLVASGDEALVEGPVGLWEVRWEGGGLQGVETPAAPAGGAPEVLSDTGN